MAGHSARIRFLPLQPADRLNTLLNAADIHLLPQRAGAEGLVMPSKLAAMMASGRPTIACASVGTDVAKAVEGCGEVVAPGDVGAMVLALQRLASAPGLRQEYGERGRERAGALWGRERILTEVFDDHPLSRRQPVRELSRDSARVGQGSDAA
jgi:colanic acid biosynthesis glycosyl transferase WcaI